MAKDKVLDTRLHDTEATSMNANIYILSRTQTQIKLLFSFSDTKIKFDQVICGVVEFHKIVFLPPLRVTL